MSSMLWRYGYQPIKSFLFNQEKPNIAPKRCGFFRFGHDPGPGQRHAAKADTLYRVHAVRVPGGPRTADRSTHSRSRIMTHLKGKTALVTGASRGIGRAAALALA